MQWILEEEVFKEETSELVLALNIRNLPYAVCRFGTSYDEFIKQNNYHRFFNYQRIFHGSFQLAKVIKNLELYPGFVVQANLEQLNCAYYYPIFGDELVNAEYWILPFGDLNRNEDRIFDPLFEKNRFNFMRPVAADKGFTGKVFNSVKEWVFLRAKMNPCDLVLLAKPQVIQREWRMIVIDNKVIAGSQYKEKFASCRVKEVPTEVTAYAQGVIDKTKYRPDHFWTIDIAEVDGKLKVLEVGSFSCAGFYAADPGLIIDAAEAWMQNQTPGS